MHVTSHETFKCYDTSRKVMMALPDRKSIDVSAPNLMSICIDENQNHEKQGRFYHRYSVEPVLFSDLNNLLILADRIMDKIDYPQASTRSRNFCDTGKNMREKGAERVKSTDEILNETGKKATFVVNVQYRQNATWQGKVMWAEAGKSCNFRSALELLKLIDGALDEAEAGVQD